MDKEIKRNVQLGVFVIVGILLFVVGIFLIGSKDNMFTKNIKISVLFTTANGIKPGDYARYNGVKVGVVKAVTLLNDTTVQVDMQIESAKQAFINKDDIASVVSDGLMGGKIINIAPGAKNSPPVQNNDFIRSSNPINTDLVLRTLTASTDNLRVISDNLSKLTSDLNTGNGTVQVLMKDSMMAKNLRQSFSNLTTATVQLKDFSSSMQQMASDVKHGKNSLGAILNDSILAQNLHDASSQIKTASDKMVSISDQLSVTMNKINSGDGAIGLLLSDTTLANDLKQSVENIKNGSNTFNEDMVGLQHTWLLKGYFKKEETPKQ